MIFTIITLIIIAAISNAVMDTIKHHWGESIFARKLVVGKWAHTFFHKLGWRNSYINGDPKQGKVKWKFLGRSFTPHPAFLDAWHSCKSIMLICLFTAMSLGLYMEPKFSPLGKWPDTILLIVLIGLLWIFTFNAFYDKIFKA